MSVCVCVLGAVCTHLALFLQESITSGPVLLRVQLNRQQEQ